VLFLAALNLRAADVIERIVATVNRHVILQSEWQDEVSFEAFMSVRDPGRTTDAQRKAALDHLIDQELLREHMDSPEFHHVTPQQVSDRIAEIRRQYPGAESESGWRATLARYGLTETDLSGRISLQLDVMRLVDSRFRSSVQVDASSIETYYNQQLLPQLHQAGAKDVSLAQVTEKIKELLTQEKMNQLLTAWLQNLRSTSEIRTDLPSWAGGGQAE
jgi:hypothetical protein